MAYRNLNLRIKMVILFGIFTLLLVSSIIWMSYIFFENSIRKVNIRELENLNKSLVITCKTAINSSIKNYLKGIAEKNRDIAVLFYNNFRAGILSEQDAKKRISEIILAQSIGKTGYIFVWDIKTYLL